MNPAPTSTHSKRGLGVLLAVTLAAGACSTSEDDASTTSVADTVASTTTTGEATTTEATATTEAATGAGGGTDCETIAALFGTDGSANPDLADPEASATCDGGTIVVSANGIPDYPYVETSPGPPRERDINYEFPATPVVAAETTDVPLVGPLGVTLAGIPIYGPTEGTGGDVGSLPGILMDCGGHNGPTGFHLHLVGTSETSDCDFSAEEISDGPQLLGYAFDGVPIYTGNAQYTSSWELTDASLFASDTWAAHSYVEGSGDLDECNGLTDADGNYAYYTTDTFPYIVGCFLAEVEIDEPGQGGGGAGGGGGGGGGRPAPGEG